MIAIIAFLGYAVQYIQRIDISVAIVCMVNNTGLKLQNEAAAQTPVSSSLNEITQMPQNNVSIVADNCFFKEQIGGKKMDGPFLWAKGML